MKKLKSDIASISKNKLIQATVLDIIGDRLSVQLSNNGRKLFGLPYTGGPVSPGKTVYIDYSSGQPVAQCRGEETQIPTQTQRPSRAPVTEFEQDEVGGPGGSGSSGGAYNFIELDDVPQAYSGQAGKTVRVNFGESGLEFGEGTEPAGQWNEHDLTHDDFSLDRFRDLTGNGDLVLEADTNNKPVLKRFAGTSTAYFWKRTSLNYKTVDKSIAYDEDVTGPFIVSGFKIDEGQPGEQGAYVNAYFVCWFTPVATGTHTFTFGLRGGIKVWFGDTLVVDSWNPADETIWREVEYETSLTNGEKFLIRIEYFNGNYESINFDFEYDGPTQSANIHGSIYYNGTEPWGKTCDTAQACYYILPVEYRLISPLPVEMVFDIPTPPEYTSVVIEMYHSRGGPFIVNDGDTVNINGGDTFWWYYYLYSTYGDYTPTINSIGLHIDGYSDPLPLFTELGDTPDSYLTHGGKVVSVKVAEDGLEFTAIAGHDPVTLAADADILLGLSTQQITLDSQSANQVFAGPTSGGAADPTFRALVVADVPTFLATRQAMYTYGGNLAVNTGSIRIYNLFGVTLTITKVHISVGTAPANQAIIVDVNENGTTIFTNQANRPQITAGNNAGVTTTIDAASWEDGNYLTVDIDQVGTGTTGANLAVMIVCNG